MSILEGCRQQSMAHLVFASSSSVYGANRKVPFSEGDNVDHPISLYAATKKANELMAHSYSHLYDLPITGLRFFTIYGPWGRPDMAYYKFVEAISTQTPIHIYNHGQMERDFTYIDDVIEGIVRVLLCPPRSEGPPYKIYNIGNHTPINLLHFIKVIESEMGIPAVKKWLPMQPGDVPSTFADVSDLTKDTGFQPQTSIEEGIRSFIQWYRSYHGIKSYPCSEHGFRSRCA